MRAVTVLPVAEEVLVVLDVATAMAAAPVVVFTWSVVSRRGGGGRVGTLFLTLAWSPALSAMAAAENVAWSVECPGASAAAIATARRVIEVVLPDVEVVAVLLGAMAATRGDVALSVESLGVVGNGTRLDWFSTPPPLYRRPGGGAGRFAAIVCGDRSTSRADSWAWLKSEQEEVWPRA